MPVYRANAKINLGLRILRRREDGFHEIETVMLPVGWSDTLTVQPASSFSFSCSDDSLPTDESNLVIRAYRAFEELTDEQLQLDVHLEKAVPYGAGLGSGSSDAAAMLLALNELTSNPLPSEVLHEIAAGIGSDVPFFLMKGACVAHGRGELLTSLLQGDGSVYQIPYPVLVAVPDVHIDTGNAYNLIKPSLENHIAVDEIVLSNDLTRWRAELVNDFQIPIASAHPPIQHGIDKLYEQGAGYAAMSGSGSSVFGVFEETELRKKAADQLLADGFRIWLDERKGA